MTVRAIVEIGHPVLRERARSTTSTISTERCSSTA
jgi:hypothetical protein